MLQNIFDLNQIIQDMHISRILGM